MDEMFYTCVMENCTLLSQKTASEPLNVATKSQVPDPLTHVTSSHMPEPFFTIYIWHMRRSYSIKTEISRAALRLNAKEDSLLFTLLSPHRSIKELNISYFNFLPTSHILALGKSSLVASSCFSADIKAKP